MVKSCLKAVAGGIAVGFGGIVYLSVEDPVAGAFLFSIGLFAIYAFGFNLYTGKVCYIPNKKPAYLIGVAVVLGGNTIGTVLMGYAVRLSRLRALLPHVEQMVEKKLSDTLLSVFIMAVFCGVMMSIAVLGYQTLTHSTGKYLALILPVMVFILSGFEHSVADLFYITAAGQWSGASLLFVAVVTFGNAIGGMLIPLLVRLTDGKKLGCE